MKGEDEEEKEENKENPLSRRRQSDKEFETFAPDCAATIPH